MTTERDRAALCASCEQVVRELRTRYQWTVGSPEELVASVLRSIDAQHQPGTLPSLVVSHYMAALYAACRQSVDEDLRTRAYTELFHALYRVASRRWPDIAHEVVQRALHLVHEHLEACREPRAFLEFALFKQLQAAKDVIREQSRDLSLADVPEDDKYGEQPALDEQLLGTEQLQVLVDALKQLDEPTRQTIVLKYFEGLSDTEIGERINKTPSHVRVLRNRGIERLRKNPRLNAYYTTE